MKYIKLFEQQWQQPDQGEELLDFSMDSLAYLMDDGYKVIVETSSDVYDAIRIRKGDGNPFVPPYIREGFNWNEVKDIILPYLIRVNRKYDLETVSFYTERLRGSISFTKGGAARIQDLLEEKKDPLYYNWNSNVNPRSQVFEEIKVKVNKLPLNESFDRWSRDQKAELKDYCEDNLAYLMDEGFKIRIGQNIAPNAVNYDEKLYKQGITLIPNPELHNVSIQITKRWMEEKEDFFWNDVEDQIIPFIMRLEKKYDIQKIRFLGEDNFHYIKDNFEEELDNQPIKSVRYIDIFLSDEKEQLNESISQKEEIEDFCDTHLAYLTDEGFYIEYEERYGGHFTDVTIRHSKREDNKYSHDFSWDEIKDRFIPFLQMLSKEYKLFNFHHEDFNCKGNQVVSMRRLDDLLSSNYYSYEDVIKDTIKADFLFYIKLKVGKRINP